MLAEKFLALLLCILLHGFYHRNSCQLLVGIFGKYSEVWVFLCPFFLLLALSLSKGGGIV